MKGTWKVTSLPERKTTTNGARAGTHSEPQSETHGETRAGTNAGTNAGTHTGAHAESKDGGSLTALTENPCAMCMPMGAAMAMKGVEAAMTILHGSQGCATYIRRHMAGHFHEPVDIASTSLSEEGTVYGGEKNLKAGIDNVTRLYTPAVIAVASTCLAETIGEDIRRMTAETEQERLEAHGATPVLIPVASPGYGGSQEEGWFAAVRAMVEKLAGTSHEEEDGLEAPFVNLILPPLNPGDVRGIKRLLDALGVRHVLLPDISETLDAPWRADWERIPEGGTRVSDIRRMHRAWCTIELAELVPDRLSTGAFLEERFGVPRVRMGLPVGIGATDHFVQELSVFSGCPVPEWLDRERGRLLDALVDSHKHLAGTHACVTGAPEFCLSVARLLTEAGVHVRAVATGSASATFVSGVKALLARLGADPEDAPEIHADIDYHRLLPLLRPKEVNLLVGGSDAGFLERALGAPLVRCGFPVHDRMGGQRMSLMGYDGALRLLDPVANERLAHSHGTFRTLAKTYLREDASETGGKGDMKMGGKTGLDMGVKTGLKPAMKMGMKTGTKAGLNPVMTPVTLADTHSPALVPTWMGGAGDMPDALAERTRQHPCYTKGACSNARVHLPIAPACNISCNYCNRKYDCVNESRPGVTSLVLTPEAAIRKYAELREKVPNLKVVGIAGPGDALANFEQTAQTLRGIREMDPEVTFCLSTNGLMLPFRAYELYRLGVTHLTVTVNAVDPKVGAALYRKVSDGGKAFSGEEGAALLLERQSIGIRLAAALGMVVKVNTVLVPGVNDTHIPEVVKAVKTWGASLSNIMPLIPAEGSVFAQHRAATRKEVDAMRERCGTELPQMTHCRQCRADAVGRLDEDRSLELMAGIREQGKPVAAAVPGTCKGGTVVLPGAGKPVETFMPRSEGMRNLSPGDWLAAVATSDGRRVDRHFGQVDIFHVYHVRGTEVTLLEKRSPGKYCAGDDCKEDTHARTLRMVEALKDCRMVLAMRMGPSPSEAMEAAGIEVVLSCDFVEAAILEAAGYVVSAEEEKQHA